MTTEEIINRLSWSSKTFPRQTLEEARKRPDEMKAPLLAALDYAREHVAEWMKEDEDSDESSDAKRYDLHTWAAFLLAEFKEKAAFPKYCENLCLDEDTGEFLWGDMLTDDFPRFLHDTYDGSMELLKKVIEGKDYNRWGRIGALEAYAKLERDGLVSAEDCAAYLRHLINDVYTDSDDEATSDILTNIGNTAIDCRLYEMIPDIRALHDKGAVDTFLYGDYDEFINHIFSHDFDDILHDKPITNTIKETEWWACYHEDESSKKSFDPEKMAKAFAEEGYRGQPKGLSLPQKKPGRNDPCPCGSGKKYKFCCMRKDEAAAAELRSRTGIARIYDVMVDYPNLQTEAADGEPSFASYFDPKGIEIDIPVYKALHHRAIPIFVKRDADAEDIENIDFLLEAFQKYNKLCKAEQIKSPEDFDAKYMVHYHARYWLERLYDLLKKYRDDIPDEKGAWRIPVKKSLDSKKSLDNKNRLKSSV